MHPPRLLISEPRPLPTVQPVPGLAVQQASAKEYLVSALQSTECTAIEKRVRLAASNDALQAAAAAATPAVAE